MPKLAALASAAANICFASSSVRLVYVRGMSPHLNMARSYIAPPFREAPFPRVLCHGCLRRVVGYLGVLDPEGLRVYKGVRTEVGELATVAAVFDAAYGNARVRSSDAIDENTAGVELACDFASQLDVSGPEITAQTELACIGRTNRRINVWNTGQRRDGTERLLIERGHAFGYSAQYGRWIKRALALYWLTAAQQGCALCRAAFHLFVQRVTKVGTGHRPQIHRRIERIADAQRLGGFDERPFEFVGDLPYQNEAFGSQADLTCVVEPSPDSSRNRLRNVGVFAGDGCVGPPQLHHGLLDDLPRFGSDCGTCPHAAGYGSTLNTPIIDDVDDVVSLENQILKDPFRETGFQHDPLEL